MRIGTTLSKFTLFCAAVFFMLSASHARAASMADAQSVVDRAAQAYISISKNNSRIGLISLLNDAKAVMIFPSVVKGGLIIGGEGGQGLMMSRRDDGTWSYPAFYRIASASFGLQFGVSETTVLLVIMTTKAFENLINGELKAGADASAALISFGADGELSTTSGRADIFYYAETKEGLYAGVSIEGSDINTRRSYNRAYYDRGADPYDILVNHRYSNEGAETLRDLLTTKPSEGEI